MFILYLTTRRQIGCCFRPVQSLLSAADLPKSRAALPLAYLAAKAARPYRPLPTDRCRNAKNKRVGQSHHSENRFSDSRSTLWDGGEQKTAPLHHHPLGGSGWRPSYIFVHPPSLLYLLSSKPLILNNHWSLALPLSSPSARCHCLGSRLLLHIFGLTSLLLIVTAVVPFG